MARRATCDILYIEDNKDDVWLFQRALQKSEIPCVVCVVEDIPEAMSYLQGEGSYNDRAKFPLPDLIVSDLAFRIDAGMEFVQWLRGQSALSDIKLICLSALEDPLRVQQIAGLAVTFIKKSVFFDDVMELIRTTLPI